MRLSGSGSWCVYIVTLLTCVEFSTRCAAQPCTSEIVRLQAQVDLAIEVHARAGPFGPEGRFATAHRQPTPKSLARAEKQLSGWKGGLQAIRALQDAREADRVGDSDRCKHALLVVRHAIQTNP